MSASPPSSEKRVTPTYLVFRNCSKAAAWDELLQDAALVGRVERGRVAHRLHALDQPAALGRVLQVHELDPDRAAVGLAQRRQDVAQRHLDVGRAIRRDEEGVQALGRKPDRLEGQQGVLERAGLERVEAGEQVPDLAEAVDQGLHPRLVRGRFAAGGPEALRPLERQLEPLEEVPPVGGDGIGVGFPEPVLRFDEILVQDDGGRHAEKLLERPRTHGGRPGCGPGGARGRGR